MNPLFAQQAVESAWRAHMRPRFLRADVGSWALHTAADDTPLISGRVTGVDAVRAIESFVDTVHLVLPVADGGQRPVLDYGMPGRIGCTWRSGGSWISLWTPDIQAVPRAPVRRPGRGVAMAPGVRAAWAMLRGPRDRTTASTALQKKEVSS
jgi:hypothetical protein